MTFQYALLPFLNSTFQPVGMHTDFEMLRLGNVATISRANVQRNDVTDATLPNYHSTRIEFVGTHGYTDVGLSESNRTTPNIPLGERIDEGDIT